MSSQSRLDSIVKTNFIWKDQSTILRILEKKDQLRFSIFCCEQILSRTKSSNLRWLNHYLITVKNFLDEKLELRCLQQAHASIRSLKSTFGTNLTISNTYNIISYIVYSATHSADAMYIVKSAADEAVKFSLDETDLEMIKREQMDYLRELVINSLSEEEKEIWLLVASM